MVLRRATPSILLALICLSCWACCGPKDRDALFVAFGDSLTAGTEEPTYPEVLEEMLDFEEGGVANEGDSGENAGDGRDRLARLLDCDTYPNAHTVLYWQGAAGLIDWIEENDPWLLISPTEPLYPHKEALADLLDHIQDNLRYTIQNVKAAGKTPIIGTYFHVMAHVSPCDASPLNFLTETMARHANDYSDLLNEKIYELADEEQIDLADIASTGALHYNEDNFANCNHPSAQGNEVIAEIWYETITSLVE